MRLRSIAFAVLGFALFVGAWHLLTLGHGVAEVAGPWLTMVGIGEVMAAGHLWKNIVASVFRVSWGFCLAAAVGIPLGIVLGWSPRCKMTFNPVIQALRPISPIAWIPIAVLMFGGHGLLSADFSAIFLVFLASFFPIVTATTSAVASVDQKFIRSARNFGVEGLPFFRRVLVPAAMPQILTGLRLALGISWVVVVAAEMVGVERGLGFQVNDSRNAIRFDHVEAAMVVIAIIGLLLDSGMSRIESAALARRGMSRR